VFSDEVISARQHFIERHRLLWPIGELHTTTGEECSEFENHVLQP
jgi:hypothetical protein